MSAARKGNQALKLRGVPTDLGEVREWEHRRFGRQVSMSFRLNQGEPDFDNMYQILFEATNAAIADIQKAAKAGVEIVLHGVPEAVKGSGDKPAWSKIVVAQVEV